MVCSKRAPPFKAARRWKNWNGCVSTRGKQLRRGAWQCALFWARQKSSKGVPPHAPTDQVFAASHFSRETKMKRVLYTLALLLFTMLCSRKQAAAQEVRQIKPKPSTEVVGDWKVRVSGGAIRVTQIGEKMKTRFALLKTPVTLDVAPAEIVSVKDEAYDALPLFNADTAGWTKGAQLRGVVAMEVTAPDYLDPNSVVVKNAPNGEVFTRGTDYEMDAQWATIGRLPNGKIGDNTKVFISYRHGLGRLDSIVANLEGKVSIRKGEAKINLPHPPNLDRNETRLANIWVFGRMTKLTGDNLFPISQGEYSQAVTPSQNIEKLLPKTLAKLRRGAPLKILAWGDSVTDGGYLPESERWQHQFVARLQQRFPQAKIELLTQGWGGRTTQAFLDEPPGSEHNYRERVLAVRPDLVISEFVNDAYLSPEQVETLYSGVLKDFNEIGAEWMIQTPHYVAPSWMALTREKNIDDDPRPYVTGVKAFAAKHNVALSDASRHWGQLYQQGIPYTTLLGNMVNHPDARGIKLFADALMELFPQR
ncbi:MAG: GDSL-type esterase/lipase family protein [Acidimicrobiales bacterium]